MNRAIAGKIIRETERLCESLANGGTLTVSSTRRFDGQPGGKIAWAAAIRLVQEKKAIRISIRQHRITMGPRPYNKTRSEMVIAAPTRDAI